MSLLPSKEIEMMKNYFLSFSFLNLRLPTPFTNIIRGMQEVNFVYHGGFFLCVCAIFLFIAQEN